MRRWELLRCGGRAFEDRSASFMMVATCRTTLRAVAGRHCFNLASSVRAIAVMPLQVRINLGEASPTLSAGEGDANGTKHIAVGLAVKFFGPVVLGVGDLETGGRADRVSERQALAARDVE